MTKLDEFIEQIQSDKQAQDNMGDLLKKLLDARASMQDPTDENEAETIVEEALRKYLEGAIKELENLNGNDNVDEEYMEKTAAAVEEAFASQGWKNYSKRSRRRDLLQYELAFNVSNTALRIVVIVEDVPKRIRVHATLPISGDKIYEYLLAKAIVDANKRFIYGAFQYDQDDGELTYEYSYPITHGFFKDDFLRIIHAVIRTAVDDDAYAAIKKAALGRYKRAERAEILQTLAPLVEDLAD